MQIKDFFGLHTPALPEHYLGKVAVLLSTLPTFTFADTLVGIVTLGVLWGFGMPAATIGSRFSYLLADGTHGQGIPAILPHWLLPWQLPGAGCVNLTDRFSPAAGGVFHGDAGRYRIAAVRCGGPAAAGRLEHELSS